MADNSTSVVELVMGVDMIAFKHVHCRFLVSYNVDVIYIRELRFDSYEGLIFWEKIISLLYSGKRFVLRFPFYLYNKKIVFTKKQIFWCNLLVPHRNQTVAP